MNVRTSLDLITDWHLEGERLGREGEMLRKGARCSDGQEKKQCRSANRAGRDYCRKSA